MNVDEYKKIKVARVKTRKSLMFFTRYFFVKRQKRKFVVSKHHEIIINALESVVSGKINRLIINIAPRYGKTEIAVKNFIAWCLSNNPSAKFIHLSYSDDLALDNSEEIKDLISSEDYFELFPEIALKKDSKSKKKWYTNQGGGVYATSASGQVTGFGAGKVDDEFEQELQQLSISEYNRKKFGGAIIIDDPIKPDDVLTVQREKVNQKFDTTIRNRVNSRNTPIIIIMQRLDPDDLCGYLQKVEPEVWTVLSLPVIDENGDPLWEFKHTIEELNALKNVNERVFETQYMQNPQPISGLLLPISTLKFANMDDIDETNVVFSFGVNDPADTGGDKYAIPFIYVVQTGDSIACFVKDFVYNTNGIEANTERTRDKMCHLGIEQMFVESNGVGLASVLGLKKILNEHQKLTAFPSTVNKDVRILSNYEFVQKYFIFDSNYEQNSEYKSAVKDLTTFSKEGDNKHKKDSIDVLCLAAAIIKIKYKKLLYG